MEEKKTNDLDLDFDRDIRIIADQYVDYLPENADKIAFLTALVKTLANQ